MNITKYDKELLLMHLTNPNRKYKDKEGIAKFFIFNEPEQLYSQLEADGLITVDENNNLELTERGRIDAEKVKKHIEHLIANYAEYDEGLDIVYGCLGLLSDYFFESDDEFAKWIEKKRKFRELLLNDTTKKLTTKYACQAFDGLKFSVFAHIDERLKNAKGGFDKYKTYAFKPKCRVMFKDGKATAYLSEIDKILVGCENIVGEEMFYAEHYDCLVEEKWLEIPYEDGIFTLPLDNGEAMYWLDNDFLGAVYLYKSVKLYIKAKLHVIAVEFTIEIVTM